MVIVAPEFLLVDADHGETGGEPFLPVEVIEGGDELSPSQVSGGPEDHDHGGIRVIEVFHKRISRFQ